MLSYVERWGSCTSTIMPGLHVINPTRSTKSWPESVNPIGIGFQDSYETLSQSFKTSSLS